ncbi:MAG: amidohydrolase family protein [Ginsengibacter sp.]
MIKINQLVIVCTVILISCKATNKSTKEVNEKKYTTVIHELNEKELPKGDKIIAFVGATLIDGNGGEPVQNSCVVIRNDKIMLVGKSGDINIPKDAQTLDVKGQTLLPGLIDSHYHNENSSEMLGRLLSHGVTSLRDPGLWIETYDSLRSSGKPIPRLFLTGPHINTYPPAYPDDAIIVQDAEEARLAVNKLIDQGATAIKVYFGLSVGMIKEICTTAHDHGLPVTAHLEITNATDAINAGLDGIEHITSFGTVLIPPREAEKYKQRVLADNDARKRGRYEVWNSLRLDNNSKADSLIKFLSDKKTFVTPTLAVFEKQPDKGDSIEVNGFRNMLKFTGQAKKGGVRIVLGSHTWGPYAKTGYTYVREMELFQEAGLSTMEIIVAATMENARFFRIDERLGSVEKGKLADMFLVKGDPLKDLKAMYNVTTVMLNGVLVSQNKK